MGLEKFLRKNKIRKHPACRKKENEPVNPRHPVSNVNSLHAGFTNLIGCIRKECRMHIG